MLKPDPVLYTANATATGGREGIAKSSDGKLDVKLSTPKELGGDGGEGTNPEQLFAAGYAACFIGAMKAVAGKQKISLPEDVSIASEVGIGPVQSVYAIEVTLNINLPGMDKTAAEALVETAHQVCPYSNATRGNVDVTLNLVD
ncbi:organic hydroperoxide resistance protein [Marinicella sp. W31]|uniref:organic hydroperoxide resistance protein n=1 Tax=Marinicella sp. W31 TaxID=3023713 RepID=UPI0037576D2F